MGFLNYEPYRTINLIFDVDLYIKYSRYTIINRFVYQVSTYKCKYTSFYGSFIFTSYRTSNPLTSTFPVLYTWSFFILRNSLLHLVRSHSSILRLIKTILHHLVFHVRSVSLSQESCRRESNFINIHRTNTQSHGKSCYRRIIKQHPKLLLNGGGTIHR